MRRAAICALAVTRAAVAMRRCLIALLVAALTVAGCGSAERLPDRGGSTLRTTYADPDGDGVLAVAPGEPLRDRTLLGPRRRTGAELARFAYVTDAHIRDEESPARAPFLDRLGAPFTSVFRPQESLTAQVLVAAVRSIDGFAPRAVVEGGDLADSSQRNELAAGSAGLNGGTVDPDSGAAGYQGIQAPSNPDPFYYRPDVDSPRHAGLLAAAQRPLRSPGLGVPWFPVAGNHDLLVDGEIAPTPATRALAIGDRAPDELPRGVRLPRDAAQARTLLDGLLPRIVPGSPRVAADPDRAELGEQAVGMLRRAAGAPGRGSRLDYTFDLGPRLRAIVLDTVRRDAGSDGIVSAEQVAFLRTALRDAGTRWVIVFSHQPLAGAEGAAPTLALLDGDPHVLATIAGHTHANRIAPHRTAAGGYWQIQTASLADYPQQARALRVLATAGGGAVVETWMLDTAPGGLPDVARELAYLDAQGGRPAGDAGGVLDRNVRLWRAPPLR